MQALRISLIQGATRWHDLPGNRDYYGALARSLQGQSDLIVLPETFTSGFTNETLANAETMQGESLAWLKALAPRSVRSLPAAWSSAKASAVSIA